MLIKLIINEALKILNENQSQNLLNSLFYHMTKSHSRLLRVKIRINTKAIIVLVSKYCVYMSKVLVKLTINLIQ